jgi:hypothetical protein
VLGPTSKLSVLHHEKRDWRGGRRGRLGGVAWRGTYGEEIQALEPLTWYNGHHLHFAEKSDLHWREAGL